jgi:hypothetical protein
VLFVGLSKRYLRGSAQVLIAGHRSTVTRCFFSRKVMSQIYQVTFEMRMHMLCQCMCEHRVVCAPR